MTHPLERGIRSDANGTQVTGDCITCTRPPKTGEKYGTGDGDWDYSGICPECWDNAFYHDEADEKEYD